MTGSDVNDPRYTLTPGMYDAGETSMGLKHLLLVKKPDAFQLGTDKPDDPKVITTIQRLGMGDVRTGQTNLDASSDSDFSQDQARFWAW